MRPTLNSRWGCSFFKEESSGWYNSFHCFDNDNTMPPMRAAQLESPAKIPNPKNETNEDFELILKSPEIPNLSSNRNVIMMPTAIANPNNVGFTKSAFSEAFSLLVN